MNRLIRDNSHILSPLKPRFYISCFANLFLISQTRKGRKMKKNKLAIVTLGSILSAGLFMNAFASTVLTPTELENIHTPFSYNVGMDFDTMEAPSANTLPRAKIILSKASTDVKLFRVYRLYAAGSRGTAIDIPTQALADTMKADPKVEAVVGTMNHLPVSADAWVKQLKNTFGSQVSQVKAILIGNEVNGGAYTATQLKAEIQAMATALANNGLDTIPVSASLSGLPRQGNDSIANALFDPYMKAIVSNWSSKWNDGYPFVEFDPYPDALVPAGSPPQDIMNAAPKVFNEYYADVYRNYISRFKTTAGKPLQGVIGETGAEGIKDADWKYGVKVNNALTSALTTEDKQAKNHTIPTFLFETIDEPGKADGQRQMGFFNSDGTGNGSSLPGWVATHKFTGWVS